jgi:hypothetical protein
MNFRGCRQEGIHGLDWTSEKFGTANDSSASIGDQGIDRQDSGLEADGQLVAKPIFKLPLASSARHTLNSIAQFGQRDYAQEYLVFVG